MARCIEILKDVADVAIDVNLLSQVGWIAAGEHLARVDVVAFLQTKTRYGNVWNSLEEATVVRFGPDFGPE